MSSGSHYTVFVKGEFLYGIPIDHVREVIHAAVLIPAPVNVTGFLGFFDFRQKLCPVFDIETLLGRPDSAVPEKHNLLVLECDTVVFALWMDKYLESLPLAEDTGETTETPGRPFVDRVFRYKGRGLSRLNLTYLRRHIDANVGNLLPPPGTRKPQDSQVLEAELELLCFSIEHLRFGIPIVDLVEVIEGYSVEPLFKTNAFLRGLINLRGQIIACVDLSEVLGLPRRKMEERNQYLLLQDNDRDLALCIDAITKKQKFPASAVHEVSSLAHEELHDYLLGVIEEDDRRIFVLSGAKIIASKHLEPYQEPA